MQYNQNLNVRLDEDLFLMIHKIKSSTDINMSSLVRRILKKELQLFLSKRNIDLESTIP